MTACTFVPLHTKSDFSLGLGTASVEELTDRACALGYRTLGLTDLENLSAQVRFHEECHKRGLRPLTGIELRPGYGLRGPVGNRKGRVILLAHDAIGYGNLCRIISVRRLRQESRVSDDTTAILGSYGEGITALTDDVSVAGRLLREIPRDRIGLLLVRPSPPSADKALRKAAARLDIPLVADLDVSFLRKSDHLLHLLHLAIRKGTTVHAAAMDPEAESGEKWLRSPTAAASLFNDVPEAVAATVRIAENCRLSLAISSATCPLQLTGEEEQELLNFCKEGIRLLFPPGTWTASYQERMLRELSMFRSLGFTPFMTFVAEIFGHCRREGILAMARGSAVSSLVLHLIGGSPIDPIAEGLLFERFLHPGKSSWPDVDIDLPSDFRDGVIHWVFQRFGKNRVAMVGVHNTFGYRSALREGLKALGITGNIVNRLACLLPPEELGMEDVDFLGLSEPGSATLGRTESAGIPPEVKRALPLVNRLVGHPRHLALHPGGIVISPHPIDGLLPLQGSPNGMVLTQYDLLSVGRLGLVKVDLLGNRCLSELMACLNMVGKKTSFQSIPLDDPPTLALIDRADTMGCFQLESPAMRSLLARLPIRKMDDIIAALALIRPGAAAGEMKRSYIRRASGQEPATATFPSMEDRLAETCGIFLYEEDIMLLLHRAAKVTLGEADELRSAIVTSGGDRRMLSVMKQRFLSEATGRGADASIASKAWKIAERLSAYSFNKAHSASYARLAYFSAWSKTRYLPEFACALLDHHKGFYPLRAEAADLVRRGIVLWASHVNLSARRSVIEGSGMGNAVRLGLEKVRGLTEASMERILGARENGGAFSTLADFLERAQPRKSEVSPLVLSGACDGLAPLSAAGYPFVHEAFLERLAQGEAPARLTGMSAVLPDNADAARVALYQGLARARNELRYLGMHVSAHPLSLLRREARRYGCISIADSFSAPAGKSVRVAVTVAAMKRVRTRTGIMVFVSVDDETGLMEGVIMPPLYRQEADTMTTPGPFLVTGTLRRQQDATYLEIYRLQPFHERKNPFGTTNDPDA